MSFLNPGEPEIANLLYRTIHFPFGLPSSHRMPTQGTKEVELGWDYKTLYRFYITGNKLAVPYFTRHEWSNVFNSIEREIATPRGRVYAYNFSQLHLGKLAGQLVPVGSDEHLISDEYRAVLSIIGHTIPKHLLSVPQVYMNFQYTWESHRLPDSIVIKMEAMNPFTEHEMENLLRTLAHRYRIAERKDVNGSARWNTSQGHFEMELVAQPVNVPPRPAGAPQSAQNPPNAPEFPYDFYRGLGLIDDEGMVEIPTILGIVRLHAETPMAQEHLLTYKP